MKWIVKLTIRRMGRDCGNCKQVYECQVEADTMESAVSMAKADSGADPDTHKFSIDLVKRK